MAQVEKKPTEEFRARSLGYELRDGDGETPTLVGNLAVFDQWAEINSAHEGHFLERISPGAFDKTIVENRDRMKVLFDHGKDPQIGNKPLGSIESLTSDERGVHYEVPLFDTHYVRELLPALRAGELGSSFRFEVTRDNWDRKAGKSDFNLRGLPQRTIKEVRMPEFGPVTFPAYKGAKAGLRSITDRMLGDRMDVEDLSCLAQMIQLGTGYIEEQDEGEDTVARMEAILASLAELVPVEVDEVEPPEDEEMASDDKRAVDADSAPLNDGAGTSHPIRRRRAEGPAPLYTGKKEVSHRWQL